MNRWLLALYDRLQSRRRWLWVGLVVVLIPLLVLALTLRYTENIMDFLPIGEDDRESMVIYQSQQSASQMVLIVEGDEPERIIDALDSCAERIPGLITEPDLAQWLQRLAYVHSQMPYFLTDSDYARLDTLLTPEATRRALMQKRQLLSVPGTGFLAQTIQTDPLSLLPLNVATQGQYSGAQQSAFTDYDGYILTADKRMGLAFYESPYGSTETQRNAALLDSLQAVTDQLSAVSGCQLRWLGAPVVAVGNARRIKTDTLFCIALSLVLISLLLLYAFPRKRDILLILLSVSFGWLFGMAALRLYTPAISAIVLGIGSVLIGIAVNYPLHLLVHQRYTSSVRQTLSEVLSPLIVGNITTIGAFLTLLPLRAEALRELGLFASAMLLGTIIFCVLVLPHFMSAEPTPVREFRLVDSRKSRVDSRKSIVKSSIALILLLSLAAGLYLVLDPQPRFDSDLSHINYMTRQQRQDFAYFESLSPTSDAPAYLAPEARTELARRANLWQHYWAEHDADSVVRMIQSQAAEVGFQPQAFAPFYQVLTDWQPTEPMTTDELGALWPGRFDSRTLNEHLTAGLSSHFDYIGLCCSLIVFLFLWLSFRNVWLALIAFAPMALSWIWILAIMQLLGIQFNIVTIILATFIFGQGDDYTIFVVEGLLYEHRTGRAMLPQYRQSIFLSALIMLVGIGVLILAQHPAMHMLGAVTLIGMGTVVLMALTIPPLLFHALLRFFPKAIK